jgi:outer membrane protein assembly factor BamB
VANEGTETQTVDIRRIAAAHGLVYVDVTSQFQSTAGFTYSNATVALDAATGIEQWRAVGLGTPVVAGTVLYVSTFDTLTDPTALVALDAMTGAELWRLPGDVYVMAASTKLVLVESNEAVIAYGLP